MLRLFSWRRPGGLEDSGSTRVGFLRGKTEIYTSSLTHSFHVADSRELPVNKFAKQDFRYVLSVKDFGNVFCLTRRKFGPHKIQYLLCALLCKQMPLTPRIDRIVERPDPMGGIRALAIALEREDRRELGRYVATILQKLANMNELFLGERVRTPPAETF